MIRDSKNEIAFEVIPKKTFFGLDKGKSHCFTAPKEINEFAIKTFGLGEGHLQADIQFEIDGELYPATIRLVRINRSKPYKLKADDLESREVIQFQWKKYPRTQIKLASLYEKTEYKPSQETIYEFNYSYDNRFIISAKPMRNVSKSKHQTTYMTNIHKLFSDEENHPKDDLLSWFWISIGEPWQPKLLPEITKQKNRNSYRFGTCKRN